MNDRSISRSGRRRRPLAPTAAGAPARLAWWLVLALAAAVVATGCAPSLAPAVRAYEHGRYPEALDELRALERTAHGWDRADAVRYALYRGLAHLALGHRKATLHWLDAVKRARDLEPGVLSSDDACRLASAWAHLAPD